jgi:hypothetical protein
MRRSAVVLAALLAGLGLLAGCDLPAGSGPRSLLPDQVPNDTPEQAPLVRVPALIHGSLDAYDQIDYYALRPPTGPVAVYVTCTGEITVGAGVLSQEQGTSDIALCDGTPQLVGEYDAGQGPVLAILPAGDGFAPYALTVRYEATLIK